MSNKTTQKKSPTASIGAFILASMLLLIGTWSAGSAARHLFLFDPNDIDPILAGGALDDLPALMRGNVAVKHLSDELGTPRREKPPRMCEMPSNYFTKLDQGEGAISGYTPRNEYIRPYRARRDFLNEREMRAAKVAWSYFIN